MDIQDYIKALEPQKNEFDRLDDLIKAYQNLPAIVDDDYPLMRGRYEVALKNFIQAIRNNGRI